jgi:uncharacterized protein
MPAVSNTSPISNLAWIGRLGLFFNQFQEVWIPRAVEVELQNIPERAVREAIDEARVAGWLRSRATSETALVNLLQVGLHSGEAEAIALAVELKADWLLIDEREGRSIARELGLPITGALGVLLRAKKSGQIKAIKPEIDSLKSKARFFIHPLLETTILREAGE